MICSLSYFFSLFWHCWFFLILASPKDICKELSDTTQRKWLSDIYKNLSLTYTKVTYAGRGFGSRIAERLNISEDQIQYAGNWNTNSMHQGYLTSLPQKFMRGMAGFDPEHLSHCLLNHSASWWGCILFSVPFEWMGLFFFSGHWYCSICEIAFFSLRGISSRFCLFSK